MTDIIKYNLALRLTKTEAMALTVEHLAGQYNQAATPYQA